MVPTLTMEGVARAWRGFRHHVAARKPVWLRGQQNVRLPEWFTERFPARYTPRAPFDSALPAEAGLEPLPDQPEGALGHTLPDKPNSRLQRYRLTPIGRAILASRR
jgi:hypothetical protein